MKIFTLILLLVGLLHIAATAQTDGDLNVSTFTSETGGNYAPRNIVAIWIENENGEFVKTLLAYAQNRKTHLNTWQASTAAAGSEYNTVDAITGATKNSHATRECMWNATDYNGNIVADGTYYLWMELTDKNNTGNYSSFAFEKGATEQLQTPDDVPSFGSLSIHWQASGVGIIESEIKNQFSITNNPGNGYYEIKGPAIEGLEIRSMNGELLFEGNTKSIDLSAYENGMYLLIIKKDQQKYIQKLIKN